MKITVEGPDPYGNDAYGKLFDDIVGDIGKSFMFSEAKLVLKPKIPLFVFSATLKNEPAAKTMNDACSFREDGNSLHISISDERYAPEILSILWKMYGRDKVAQQTRFDLTVEGGLQTEIQDLVIASGEESIKEIMGAFWRALPEGIRVRKTFFDGRVITVVATEEILTSEIVDEAYSIHKETVKKSEAEEDV